MASSLGEGAFRWIKQCIEKLPIPQITKSNQHIVNTIIALSNEILRLRANCAILGARSGGEEFTPQTPSGSKVCHSEPLGEESLSNLLESPQRFFTPCRGSE